MKTCPKIQQLFDYLMDELPPSSRETVERHLESCAACRASLETLCRRRARLDHQFQDLTPREIPYRLWHEPAETRPNRGRYRWALAGTAACVVLTLLWTQKLSLQCGTGQTRAARFAHYRPEPVTDALEDWNEKRLTVTLIQEGSPQATVIHTALSPDKITEETVTINARGMVP